MKLTGFLILVLIGVGSCDYQHEKQLNRVLVESIESMQNFNEQIYFATKEKSYELRFELESLRRDEQRKDGYSKLNNIYKRYLYIDSICDRQLVRLDTLKSQLLRELQVKETTLQKNHSPQTVDFSQLTENQLQKPVDDFF